MENRYCTIPRERCHFAVFGFRPRSLFKLLTCLVDALIKLGHVVPGSHLTGDVLFVLLKASRFPVRLGHIPDGPKTRHSITIVHKDKIKGEMQGSNDFGSYYI